jgi:hypothetical protein
MKDEISITGNLFRRLEDELGLPANWLFTLVKESDWSFVIKLHALFEAALTHLLEASLQKPELGEFISRMNTSGRLGKVAMARALELVDKEQARYLELLSRMRNDCVHDVRNVSFTLSAHAEKVSKEDRSNMVELVRRNTARGAQVGPLDELVMQGDLKTAVWLTGVNVVAVMYNQKEFLAAMARAAKEGRTELNTVDDLADWDSGTYYGRDLKRD